jgi:iron(II)-dependent oxidoreductase
MCRRYFYIFLLFGIFSSACKLFSPRQGTVDHWAEGVHKMYVTTDPPGASLIFTNIDAGDGTTSATNISPNYIYFSTKSHFGVYLNVAKAGYETQVIKLDPAYKEIHVILQPKPFDDTTAQKSKDLTWRAGTDFSQVKGLPEGFDDSPKTDIISQTASQHSTDTKKKGVLRDLNKKNSKYPGMVYIPPGDFIMGNNRGNADEKPEHRVYLKGYFIDTTEVTNSEYRKFLKATDHYPPNFLSDPDLNGPDQPVVGVSWEDANAYANWVGKRLPTEAEWEKAARGTKKWEYPFGHHADDNQVNKFGKSDGYPYTAPVDKFPEGKSPYGLYQMAGNVQEWCADWYQANLYTIMAVRNPQGPNSGKYKIIRGGSWGDEVENLTTTKRWYKSYTSSDYKTGFRCAKSE